MEALQILVLPRAAGVDVERSDISLREPGLHLSRDGLRAVIAAQVFRRTMHRHRVAKPIQHVLRGQGAVGVQHVALTRVFAEDRQNSRCSAALRGVGNEVLGQPLRHPLSPVNIKTHTLKWNTGGDIVRVVIDVTIETIVPGVSHRIGGRAYLECRALPFLG